MNEPQSQPISRHLRDAFYGAVQLYPNWTGLGHAPVVSVDGRRYTISEVCNLAIEFSDGLPDDRPCQRPVIRRRRALPTQIDVPPRRRFSNLGRVPPQRLNSGRLPRGCPFLADFVEKVASLKSL